MLGHMLKEQKIASLMFRVFETYKIKKTGFPQTPRLCTLQGKHVIPKVILQCLVSMLKSEKTCHVLCVHLSKCVQLTR